MNELNQPPNQSPVPTQPLQPPPPQQYQQAYAPPPPPQQYQYQQPYAPAPQPAPVAYAAPMPSGQSPYPLPSQKKSPLLLIIILIMVSLLMVIGGGAAYLLAFSDAAVAKRQSTNFMKALTTGQTQKATSYAVPTEYTEKFLESAGAKTQGSFKLRSTAKKNDKRYYLYSLSNPDYSAARTILTKINGTWQVSSYVYGSDNLALMPNEKSIDDTSPEPVDVAPIPAAAPAATCLVQTDFDSWYKWLYGTTASSNNFHFEKTTNAYTDNVHFLPDSLEFANSFDNTSVGSVVAFSELVKAVEGKQYLIRIRGSVATTDQASSAFANQRADKIKNLLISKGVPAAKITIDAPDNISSLSGSATNEVTQRSARSVILTFDPTCVGSPQPSAPPLPIGR